MKVILLQDVPKIGKKHEVKDVAEGYATNMLIPKKLAEHATAGAIKKAEAARAALALKAKAMEEALMKQFKKVEGVAITLKGKASEKGHLFAAIHNDTIAKAIGESIGMEFPVSSLHIPEPIKSVGEHEIEIKIQDKSTKVKVVVEAL